MVAAASHIPRREVAPVPDQRMKSRTARDTDVIRGKRVLVTRPRAQSSALVQRLRALGAEPVLFPTIRITSPSDGYTALDQALHEIASFDWIVFTSVNGVKHVWQRLTWLGIDPHLLQGVRLAAIGPATAKALRARGMHVEVMPERYVAEALLTVIPTPTTQRFLLPRADAARGALRTGLQAAGAVVVEVHAYCTVPVAPSRRALATLEAGIDVLTFTSSSTVQHFVQQLGHQRAHALAAGGRVVVIGPITADTAREFGLRVDVVATEYTIPGLIEAVIEVCV